MTDALNFIFEQIMKRLYISIPGIIDSYDPATKRATVHPAIRMQETDGTTTSQSSITNVPVLWPSGGGFTIISPLPAGTPVEIRFSQRGITAFKETFLEEDPGDGIFAKEDCWIIPSFGALTITPASTDGISMQDEAADNFIYIEDGDITITSTSVVNITASTTNVSGDLTVGGDIDVTGIITSPAAFNGADSDQHIHGGVTIGAGFTAVPS